MISFLAGSTFDMTSNYSHIPCFCKFETILLTLSGHSGCCFPSSLCRCILSSYTKPTVFLGTLRVSSTSSSSICLSSKNLLRFFLF